MARKAAAADVPLEDEPPSGEGDPNYVTSLARGLSVILAFTGAKRTLTISDISRETGLSRAAVRRLLLTLEKLGYVVNDGRAFRLLPKALSLGQAYISSTPLTSSAQELLDRLSEELHESVSITVFDEGNVTFVARSAGRRLVSANLTVGARLPAFCTSLGRILLAHQTPDALNRYFKSTQLKRYTPTTEVREKKLRAILTEVKELGYSLTDSEFEVGLTSIAVAVPGPSGIEAALGVAAIRRPADALRDMAPTLKLAARELGYRLAY